MFAESRHRKTAAPDSAASARVSGQAVRGSRQYPAASAITAVMAAVIAMCAVLKLIADQLFPRAPR
jgi:hypothetical protein